MFFETPPVIDEEGCVDFQVQRHGGESVLRVALQRHVDDTKEVKVVFALPLIAVDGLVEEFLLDIVGDASGCELFLEAGDARGWGFAYSFGRVDLKGECTCSTDAQRPGEYWGARKEEGTPGIVPPVQPYRLTIVMDAACGGFDLALRALRVTGQVRLAPPGIASA